MSLYANASRQNMPSILSARLCLENTLSTLVNLCFFLPCNLSTVIGPTVEGLSLVWFLFRISATGFGTEGNHWLRSRLTAWAVRSWGGLGAFVFRSALVWVVLLIWGRSIVRAFLPSPGALTLWIGLNYRRWEEIGEKKKKEKEMPSKNTTKKNPSRWSHHISQNKW